MLMACSAMGDTGQLVAAEAPRCRLKRTMSLQGLLRVCETHPPHPTSRGRHRDRVVTTPEALPSLRRRHDD